MGVLRHSYFFADLQTILQEYGLVCKDFFVVFWKNKYAHSCKLYYVAKATALGAANRSDPS